MPNDDKKVSRTEKIRWRAPRSAFAIARNVASRTSRVILLILLIVFLFSCFLCLLLSGLLL